MKINKALRFPDADGVNITLTTQVLWGVSTAPAQVSALVAKSLAFVPPIVTVEMERLVGPVLVTVSVWGALVAPTICGPKVRLAGERLTTDGEILATKASSDLPLQPSHVPWNALTVGKSGDPVVPTT